MRSAPGEYHGFLWFFFMNEQVLRFLNMRYPRDYDTVPRLYFWGFHLLWLFPWSLYFPALAKLSYKPLDRAGKVRLLALCWAGFLMVFFTFSTTQEYYSMPCYPALALLLGSAMAAGGAWIKRGNWALSAIALLAAIACSDLVVPGAECARPRRYLAGPQQPPGSVHALARPHGRSHHRFVCLSARSLAGCGAGLSHRRNRELSWPRDKRPSWPPPACPCCSSMPRAWRWWYLIPTCRRGHWRMPCSALPKAS